VTTPDVTLPLALFDFDDTLSDRAGEFRNWATKWIDRHDINDPDALEWMCATDDGGYLARDLFFRQAIDRFGMADSRQDLVDDYVLTAHDDYQADPGLYAKLEALIASGWRIGIVTNGGDGQDTKIDKVGIRPLLSCAVVSGNVGIRKPDPAIFHLAVEAAGGAGPEAPWMVGDNARNDIIGGRDAGLQTIWISFGEPWTNVALPPDRVAVDLPSALGILSSRVPH